MRALWIILQLLCLSAYAGVKNDAHNQAPTLKDSSVQAVAADTPDDHLDLLQRLKARASSSATIPSALRIKLSICDRCHAASLHSDNSYLPILQGQNTDYLFAKILYFKTTERSYHPLRAETQVLSAEEIMDISLYYARQQSSLEKELVLPRFDGGSIGTSNKEDVLQPCYDCHGQHGNGNSLVPAISGQNENYLSYRLREISNHSSMVHQHSVATVNCHVPPVDLAQSKSMARQLAMVIESERVHRGETIYRDNCSRCHDRGKQGAPLLSDSKNWSQRIRQGTRELVRNTIMGKLNMPVWGGNHRLSRNQIKDAIHFMIHQASLSQ